jgi:hypothetical protein
MVPLVPKLGGWVPITTRRGSYDSSSSKAWGWMPQNYLEDIKKNQFKRLLRIYLGNIIV